MAKTQDTKKSNDLIKPNKWARTAHAITKISLCVAIVCVLCLSAGFVWYSYQIKNITNLNTPQKSDAIVVLTGGANRIQTAFTLMDKNLGERLLITGVNDQTTKRAIFNALNRDIQTSTIKVDLDHLALDTIGNAIETAHWAKVHNYKKLIIVTSDFHITRSLLEFKKAMPDIKLIPYPALMSKTKKADQSLRTNLKEYSKLVASILRIQLFEHLPLTNMVNAY